MKDMKNLVIIILVAISAFSCKKEDEKPVSKSAPLKVEFSASAPSPIYCKLSLNCVVGGTYTTPTSSSIAYDINVPVQGGQTMIFSSIGYDPSGNRLTYGTYDIKVTYNGVEMADKHFTNNTGVNCTLELPFIK
jgi:hypothetical protein